MENEYFASINEVSKRLSVPAHTLRYWEKQFPSAIKPTTGAGGRRYYRTETVDKLVVIKDLLYTHGMTIAGVKKLLHDGKLPNNALEMLSNSTDSTSAPARDIPNSSNNGDIDMAIKILEKARDLLQ